jgi:hypothetical protein
MEFLDPKEQVIDIKLTSYGRYLLSVGKFKPEMYAFYDDDIIYDYNFADVDTELQNSIEDRIQNETPRFAAQSIYRGAETAIFSSAPNIANQLMPGALSDVNNKIKTKQPEPDAALILQNPLGTSALNSDKMPAWSVGFHKAPLTGSSYILSGSNQNIFIPQLECDVKYRIWKLPEDPSNTAFSQEFIVENEDAEIYDQQIVFEDGSSIEYKDDFVFLQIEEANAEFLNENYTIEAYEIIPVAGTAPFATANDNVLKKLYFMKNEFDEPTPENVEYFFDITMDREIDSSLYCSLVGQSGRVQNIYSDRIFTCPDIVDTSVSLDVYNTGENANTEDVC